MCNTFDYINFRGIGSNLATPDDTWKQTASNVFYC